MRSKCFRRLIRGIPIFLNSPVRRRRSLLALAVFGIWVLSTTCAVAHPASGIAVDDRGSVFFVDSEKGVLRVDNRGKLTLISESAMHFMALDRVGTFANSPPQFGEWFGRLTPKGENPTLISCSDFPCVVGKDGNLYSGTCTA